MQLEKNITWRVGDSGARTSEQTKSAMLRENERVSEEARQQTEEEQPSNMVQRKKTKNTVMMTNDDNVDRAFMHLFVLVIFELNAIPILFRIRGLWLCIITFLFLWIHVFKNRTATAACALCGSMYEHMGRNHGIINELLRYFCSQRWNFLVLFEFCVSQNSNPANFFSLICIYEDFNLTQGGWVTEVEHILIDAYFSFK